MPSVLAVGLCRVMLLIPSGTTFGTVDIEKTVSNLHNDSVLRTVGCAVGRVRRREPPLGQQQTCRPSRENRHCRNQRERVEPDRFASSLIQTGVSVSSPVVPHKRGCLFFQQSRIRPNSHSVFDCSADNGSVHHVQKSSSGSVDRPQWGQDVPSSASPSPLASTPGANSRSCWSR